MLGDKEKKNIKLRDVSEKLENRLLDFKNHINNLLDQYQSLEESNKKHEATIVSLERYIEIMDKSPKHIKNERGAGRKKKYTHSFLASSIPALKSSTSSANKLSCLGTDTLKTKS